MLIITLSIREQDDRRARRKQCQCSNIYVCIGGVLLYVFVFVSLRVYVCHGGEKAFVSELLRPSQFTPRPTCLISIHRLQ